MAAGRVFFPFPSDTLGGIGADPFIQWLKGMYTASDLIRRAEGGDALHGRFALDALLAELLATLVRDNHRMIERLTFHDRS